MNGDYKNIRGLFSFLFFFFSGGGGGSYKFYRDNHKMSDWSLCHVITGTSLSNGLSCSTPGVPLMSNRAAGFRPEKISKQVLKFKVDCLYIICSSVIDYFEVFLLQNKKKSMVDKGYGKAGKSWEVRSFWLLLEFHGSWVEIMRNSEKCLEMPNCFFFTSKPMSRK